LIILFYTILSGNFGFGIETCGIVGTFTFEVIPTTCDFTSPTTFVICDVASETCCFKSDVMLDISGNFGNFGRLGRLGNFGNLGKDGKVGNGMEGIFGILNGITGIFINGNARAGKAIEGRVNLGILKLSNFFVTADIALSSGAVAPATIPSIPLATLSILAEAESVTPVSLSVTPAVAAETLSPTADTFAVAVVTTVVAEVEAVVTLSVTPEIFAETLFVAVVVVELTFFAAATTSSRF